MREEFVLDLHFCPDCYELSTAEDEVLEEKYGDSFDRILQFEDNVEDLEFEYDSWVEIGEKENDLQYCLNQKCQCCGSKESGYRHHMIMPTAILR